MHRFFVHETDIQKGTAWIAGEDVKHIAKVLRLGPGDLLSLCNGQGMDYTARIDCIEKERVRLSIIQSAPCPAEPVHRVTLYQGLPKAGKMETIIQKCVELGACAFVPINAQRSVVKITPQDFRKKIPRYQRVAYEAAKQSGRGIIPQISDLSTFAGADMTGHDLILIADEEEHATSLRDILQTQDAVSDIALVIGPEGGLDRAEVAALVQKGGRCLTLGPRILRTETAGMAALAMILYALEDM